MVLNKYVSIDLGNKSIKIVEGKEKGNCLIIDRAFTIATPINSFNDGQILDKENLKSAIYGALEAFKIKSKKAVCTLESTSIITREISLPYAKDEEMDTMVKYEVEQYLPIMLDDYVVEYKIIDKFEEEDIKKCRVLVAAIPKLIVENFLKLLHEIKLKPLALDLNSNAISKIFNKKLKINDNIYNLNETIAVLDIGYRFISIDIISKGIPQFSRLINSGGKDIDINIANHFNLSLEESEKRKIADCNLEVSQGLTKSAIILNDAVKSSVDNWITEIQRVFQYYQTRTTGNKIDYIYLHGGSSNLKGLENYMKDAIQIKIQKINDINGVKFCKGTKNFDVENYLNTIGAIIRLGR